MKAKNKQKIKILFLVSFVQEWNKFELLYKYFSNDLRYQVDIIICPVTNLGTEFMVNKIREFEEYFDVKGIKYSKVYKDGDYRNLEKRNLIDLKSDVKPDIIFHNIQYYGQIPDQFFVSNCGFCLNCYIPYAFYNGVQEWWFDVIGQNYMWAVFGETQCHKNLAQVYSKTNGKNWVVSGYPALDFFLAHSNDVKPVSNCSKKIIIFAPHHLKINLFVEIAEDIILLTNKYKNSIDFVFKPHPTLKEQLVLQGHWSKKKTEDYYKKWNNIENRRIVEGSYEELFIESDGLIHNCGSFMVEYLALNKPVLYLVCDVSKKEVFNECCIQAYDSHYKAEKISDIDAFIKDVILNQKDYLKDNRFIFINQWLMPHKNQNASSFIFNYINKSIYQD